MPLALPDSVETISPSFVKRSIQVARVDGVGVVGDQRLDLLAILGCDEAQFRFLHALRVVSRSRPGGDPQVIGQLGVAMVVELSP